MPETTLSNQPASARRAIPAKADILIRVFARGAMDGLNVIIPHGDKNYYAARPTIAIPAPDHLSASSGDGQRAIDLDGFFGLHPALIPLKPAWDAGALAFVHASGSPDPTHSHFDAQDFMERGLPGDKRAVSGWLNRCLPASAGANASPLRAVAAGVMLPMALRGPVPAVAMRSLAEFQLGGARSREPALQKIGQSLQGFFASGSELDQKARTTFAALQAVQKLNPGQYKPQRDAKYPDGDFGQGLKQIAQLVRSEVGLEAAALDIGGWDTHSAEGTAQGQLARLLADLGGGLGAFYTDLSDLFDRITLVVMTEFGRRVAENGSGGTDHGHGSVMFVISNNLAAARVHARWPGLAQEQLYGPGDLAVTTDFRQVLAEIVQQRLPAASLASQGALAAILPGFTPAPPLGLFK